MKFFRQMLLTPFLFLVIVSATVLRAQEEAPALNPEDVRTVKAIFDEVLVSAESYRLLEHLSYRIGHRLSGSAGAAKAVAWAKRVMEDYGFDKVFLQEVMVPHWERGNPEVARIGGASGTDLRVLAIGGSVATPEDGLTAEVVEVQSLDEVAELGEARIRGKIVFYNRAFDHRNISTGAGYGGAVDQRVGGASRAAQYGAVGVVIRSVTSMFDDAPHTGTLSYADTIPRIPAAALGMQSADRLAEALRQDPHTRLFLKMDCRWLPDALSHNVVGELKGSAFPEKYIVIGGHLDSWDVGHGAHDDGAGCMQAIGVLRTFQKLGIRPRHTLRAVMFMNEENGTRGGKKYAELAVANNEQHLLAIESDAGGFSPRGFGVSSSDAVLEKMRGWLPYFDRNTVTFFRKGGGGVDIRPLHQATGVPMVGLSTEGQRLFDVHHSEHDIFENVNRRELELGTGVMAVLVYLVDKYGL